MFGVFYPVIGGGRGVMHSLGCTTVHFSSICSLVFPKLLALEMVDKILPDEHPPPPYF